MMEDQIKTEYLKNRIKTVSKNQDINYDDYLESMIFLERWLSGEIDYFHGRFKAARIKRKYEDDYWGILKELKPEEFEKIFNIKHKKTSH
ncbi:MAG: hypothetical protein J7J89_01125 [Thermoplasmata archaeon]|nr:hypothetical protein [Thermoplasmata archaeon]